MRVAASEAEPVTGPRRSPVRGAASLGLVALLGVPLAGQSTTPAADRFEVADVHPSIPVENGSPALNFATRIGVPRNGRYEIRRATMVELVRTAYGVEPDRIAGGPPWLEMDRYDVIAKVPQSATRDSVKPMLRTLLADRFGLVVRQEITAAPAQVLVRTGELRIKEAQGGTAATCQQNVQPNAGAGRLEVTMACRGMSLAAFAEQLTRAPGLTGLTGVVVDGTGLPGTWDFDLLFSPAQLVSQMGGTTFIQALGQLGIRFEAKDVPLPTITVERVNRAPTANDAAAVAKALPPPPKAEFEVAEIKPSAPGARANMRNLPNGQLTLTAVPLRTLIGMAWSPPNAASIVGPRGLDDTFDVIAKMSVDTSQQLDAEQLGPMLQNLLIDRLKMRVRWEERPLKGYSLVADGSHKLVKSDPASRTRCVTPPVTARTPATGPMQTLNCQNITMGEFVAQLQRVGGGFFEVPVLDETGLDGRWNFTITFSPPALAQALANARLAAPPGAAGAVGAPGLGASDPTGVMTLEEAIDRQMGLKLRARQRPGRVLVIESVGDRPTPLN
jgi:uncharacterized protein (TIGR03435 family)